MIELALFVVKTKQERSHLAALALTSEAAETQSAVRKRLTLIMARLPGSYGPSPATEIHKPAFRLLAIAGVWRNDQLTLNGPFSEGIKRGPSAFQGELH
jgi:hypothetical protein